MTFLAPSRLWLLAACIALVVGYALLADEWPPFFATFDRLLEIVGADEGDKERARARYAFYQKRGYDIRVNDIGAKD